MPCKKFERYFWLMVKISFLTSLLVLIGACSSPKKRKVLTSSGAMVTTMMPLIYGTCQPLTALVAQGVDIREVEIDARNKAAELGANYVDLDVPRADWEGLAAGGKAYKCKNHKNQ